MKRLLYLIALFLCACFTPEYVNASGNLIGNVTDSVTGLPISGALVIVTKGNNQRGTTMTDVNGNYSFAHLSNGNYTVVASQSGYQTQASGARISNNNTTIVNFELVPEGGTISGTVTDTASVPIQGATVEIFQGSTLITTETTNFAGNYSAPNLAPGIYTVNASAIGFQTQSQGASVQASNVTVVDFALASNPGSISGHISDSVTTNPIVDALVNVYDGSVLVGFSDTDVNGNYSIPSLPPAFYTVVVSATDFQTKSVGASVSSNVTTTVSLALDPAGGTIAGVVTDASSGNPISAASIQVFQGPTLVVSVLTDPDGSYSVSDIAPGSYSVVASADNHQDKVLGAIVLSNATTTVNFALDPSPGSIAGNVTDAVTTNPIAGVSIQIFDGPTLIADTLTDPNGDYLVTDLAPGSYAVNATKAGYQTQVIGATVASNSTTTVNFALITNPGAIAGTVTDAVTTNPIAGATILVFRGRTYMGSALTDVNGNYTVSNLAPGQYFVNAEAKNYQSAVQGATVVSNVTTTADFTLEPTPGNIAGTVTNSANGNPIPGTKISVLSNSTLVASTLTDPSGNYSIVGLAPGNYTVVANATNFNISAVGANVTANNTTTVNFALTVTPGNIIGTVRDAVTTSLIAGAEIDVYSGQTLIASTLTDPNGNYQVQNLAPGSFVVTASKPTYQTQALGAIVTANATTIVNFALEKNPGTISGTVTDATTTNPISGVNIQVFDRRILVGIGVTDTNGNYTIPDLIPGQYTVIANAGSTYRNASQGAIVFANTTTTVNFALQINPGTIAGTVTSSANGSPIPGTEISVFNNLTLMGTAITDPNGNYAIPGLAPGSYAVVANAANFDISAVGAIVTANNTTIINFALTPLTGKIAGTVTNSASNTPIAGATIQVYNGLVLYATALTDPSGNYNIPNLLPDTYTVVAIASGFRIQAKTATVSSNQTTVVNFSLGSNPGTISGKVTDAITTNPIPDATVAVFQDATLIDFALTDANGNYTIPDLAPGNYIVVAIAHGYRAAFSAKTMVAGQATIANFALNQHPGSIAGPVTSKCRGTPIPGALIIVTNGPAIVGFGLTDPNGNYEIDDLAPGTYTVTAAKKNFVTSSSSATVTANITTIVNFTLVPTVLPPASITGCSIKNKFLDRTDLVHVITWTPSPSSCVIGYQIFRNGKEIAFVSSTSKLEFLDHDRKKKTDVYSVKTKNLFGLISDAISVTVDDKTKCPKKPKKTSGPQIDVQDLL